MFRNIYKTLIVLLVFAIFAHTSSAQSGSIVSTNVTNVTGNGAVLQAEINPNGYIGTMWFEFGTDSNLYTWNETEHVAIDDAYYPRAFSRTIGGLKPNTAYYFRAVTDNGRSEIKGNIFYFVTGNATQSGNQNNQTNQSTENAVNKNNSTSDTEDAKNTGVVNTANALFAGDFLPTNLLGWLILLFVAGAIIYLVKKIVQE